MHENFQRKLMSRFLFVYLLFFFCGGKMEMPFSKGIQKAASWGKNGKCWVASVNNDLLRKP